MKKYRLTNECRILVPEGYIGNGIRTLFRIQAAKAFEGIEQGSCGGWIASEDNLSHDGNAWVTEHAAVFDCARALHNSVVDGYACVRHNALIKDFAVVGDHADISGCAQVGEHSIITGHARIYGHAEIDGHSIISDYAEVKDEASIRGNAIIRNNAVIKGGAIVEGDAIIGNDVVIGDHAWISASDHFFAVGEIDGHNFTTFYRDVDNEITVLCGDFVGKVDEFLRVIVEKSDSKTAFMYRMAVEMAQKQINLPV